MKKLKYLLPLFLLTLTGCIFNNDSMDNISVVTTSYPIEYVTNYLYGEHSTIYSIYPKDDDSSTFKVTNVLLTQYSDNDLFIFNGLSEEKDYLKHMAKKNKNLKIIDATQNMSIINSNEELWLDPNNLLTIANNIKKGFKEYINSNYLIDEVNQNYENLRVDLTNLDGNYYSTLKNANYKTIIVSDDTFLYLEKYGITVISLDPDTVTDKTLAEAKSLISNGTCNYIFIRYGDDSNSVKDFGVDTKELYTMTNLYDVNIDKTDYITLMNQNLENLKLELYK